MKKRMIAVTLAVLLGISSISAPVYAAEKKTETTDSKEDKDSKDDKSSDKDSDSKSKDSKNSKDKDSKDTKDSKDDKASDEDESAAKDEEDTAEGDELDDFESFMNGGSSEDAEEDTLLSDESLGFDEFLSETDPFATDDTSYAAPDVEGEGIGKIDIPEYEPTVEQDPIELTHWIPDDTRQLTMTLDIPPSTTRFEVFYTATSAKPVIEFTSATDANTVYSTEQDVYREDGFCFVTRDNLRIHGYDDFRYMAIYISDTPDPGKWTMTVTVPKDTTETFMVSTDIYSNWKDMPEEFRTPSVGILFWYIDDLKSLYKDNPINTINRLIIADDIPEANRLQPVAPEVEDHTNQIILLGVLAFLIIAGLITFLVIHSKREKKAKEKERRQAIVDKENEKLQRRKDKDNAELDKVLDDLSDEYIDDDFSDYFTEDLDDDKHAGNIITAESLGLNTPGTDENGYEPINNEAFSNSVTPTNLTPEPVAAPQSVFGIMNDPVPVHASVPNDTQKKPSWLTDTDTGNSTGFF